MAEFKFSCPQCTQHIQCDASYAGVQIACPVCQQTITVPQPPVDINLPPKKLSISRNDNLGKEHESPSIISPLPQVKAKKKWSLVTRIVIVLAFIGLSFGAFLGFRIVQFVHYARTHPHQAQPGEAAFREANRVIDAGHGNVVFGNTDQARALAKEYSISLKILRDNLFSKGNITSLVGLEGDFMTYCQLNDDSCVFLVHVPELRKFTKEAKDAMANLAWINAQAVLKTKIQQPPATVVVGVKGLMFYDAILIGDFVAVPQPNNDGIRKRGSGVADTSLFYPYFAQKPAASSSPQ